MNTNDNNNGNTNNNQIPAAAMLAAPSSFGVAINSKPERSEVERSILSLIEESPRIRELELRVAGVEGDDIESKIDKQLEDLTRSRQFASEIADLITDSYEFSRAVERSFENIDMSEEVRNALDDDSVSEAVCEYLRGVPDEVADLIKEAAAAHAAPASNERLDALEQRLAKVERMMEQITTLTKCIVDLAGAVNADSKKAE